MDSSILKHYQTIGKVQSVIANASTLDEALRESLRVIVDNCKAESAVMWYVDAGASHAAFGSAESVRRLRPYYWIGPVDLTSKVHKLGEGSVGQVFESRHADRRLDFKANPDRVTVGDFASMDVTSMICVPFSNNYEDIGVIQLVNHVDGRPFSEEEGDICEIMVGLAAIALEDNEKIQTPWEPGSIVMSLRNITREFHSGEVVTKVLKGVNLDVYEGEFLALLGESGCGKSTLLNIIGGMDRPTSGTFRYLNQDLSQASKAALTEYRRFNIGFVFQRYNLMPNLTSIQNLKLIAELVDNPMDADEALALVGLADRKRSYPSQLSGGQQQRVSIARALVKSPRVILADEPTAALDYATSIEVLQVLERVVDQGATMVMVTHNEEIARMADRVVRMRDGRMHEVTINRHPARAVDLVW